MEKYEIESPRDYNNYLVINLNGYNVLIDSGSPDSFGDIHEITLLNRKYYIKKNLRSTLGISELVPYIGNIDALLGGDILNQLHYEINLSKGIFAVSDEPIIPDDAFELPVTYFSNIPVIQFNVGGNNVRAFFDTGAPVSYVSPDIASGYEPVDRAEDFYPLYGIFTTDIYEIPVEINGTKDIYRFGILPNRVRSALKVFGVNNILGHDYLRKYTASLSANPDKFWSSKC